MLIWFLWIVCFVVTLHILKRRDQLSAEMFILALTIWPMALIAAAMLPRDQYHGSNGIYWPGDEGSSGPEPQNRGPSEPIAPLSPSPNAFQPDFSSLSSSPPSEKASSPPKAERPRDAAPRNFPLAPKANWKAIKSR